MSPPFTTGMIGGCETDLRNFSSDPQIDVSVSLGRLLGRARGRLLTALAGLLATLALEVALDLREADGRHRIDLAPEAHVDRVQGLRHRAQEVMVAAQFASASALAACWAVNAAAARSAASCWARRTRVL
jgi:hypothetical protein